MHSQNLHNWQHDHPFLADSQDNERRTVRVILLTVVMMAVEIGGGWLFGSMALLADGWHMGTHAAALGITVFAYRYARRHADNPRFSFGTGKVGELGGFASSIALLIAALLMAVESVERLVTPVAIRFDEAIAVAVVGLAVNVASAFMLHGGHHHGHGHHHDHEHEHGHHHDHNLRAAYLHVLADAMTSVLAIVALLAGRSWGWNWLDPLMGIVGALVISRWAVGLLRETGRVLLDSGVEPETLDAVRSAVENDSDNRLADLHVWRVAPGRLSVVLSVVTHHPRPPEHYKKLLHVIPEVAHVTVEVNGCPGPSCLQKEANNLQH